MNKKREPIIEVFRCAVKLRLSIRLALIAVLIVGLACFSLNKYINQEISIASTTLRSKNKEPKMLPTSFACVHLFDRSNWLVAEPNRILRTEDGGNEWSLTYEIKNPTDERYQIYDLRFIDSQTGFLILGGRITGSYLLNTIDGGNNWSEVGPIKLGSEELTLESCYFVDKLHGWVTGFVWSKGFTKNPNIPQYTGIVLATQDGGKTWKQQQTTLPKGYFRTGTRWVLKSIYFMDTKKGWVAGEGGVIFWTNDGGNTWHLAKAKDVDFQNIQFLNDQFGWATYKYGNSSWGVSITNNSGRVWKLVDETFAKDISKVDAVFLTENHGFALNLNLYETRNGGREWKRRRIDSETDVLSYNFLGRAKDGTLVTLGLNDQALAILVSDDNGLTWQSSIKRK